MSDEQFVGWAPCVHSAEERERVQREYLTGLPWETLLWRISMLSTGIIELASDQWVRAVVEGHLFPGEGAPVAYRTSIQGDSFELALTETYRRWLARHDEVCGVDDRPWVEDSAGPDQGD